MKIGKWNSETTKEPYIIAEVGVNHECSIETAKLQIRLAKEGGADAVKFQTYKAETLTCRNSPSYWNTDEESTKNQFDLFKRYDAFGESEYNELAAYCNTIGVNFMSTPFDLGAVEWLNNIVPAFKIASADITNLPLLKAIAPKGKPVILSTGASNIFEIDYALNVLKAHGASSIAVLHCALIYPCPFELANLSMLTHIAKVFPNVTLGYSDHTKPDPQMHVVTTAWLLGAQIIEKHFTHDKLLPGNDHYHSMNCDDLKYFRKNTHFISSILGGGFKEVLDEETEARKFARRSLVSVRFIPKGKVIETSDLICKRPGTGMSPIFIEDIIGKKAVRDIEDDHILHPLDIE